MTHGELVLRAVRWLYGSRGCGVVIAGGSITVEENPDAIGWKGNGSSILLEAKSSRSDFLRDRHKEHRERSLLYAAFGMGNERYYITPPGLLNPAELAGGWGLLECGTRVVKTVKKAAWQCEKNSAEEMRLLLSHIRRTQEVGRHIE